jgi:hypothetical protein
MLWACDKCREYQDIAGVEIRKYTFLDKDIYIDSVAIKVNDSITGCGNPRYKRFVGSRCEEEVRFEGACRQRSICSR